MNILDRFTSIDDLLVSLLERIGGVTEEDTHFFSYPNDGTRATIVKGTTTLDFMSGTVMTPAGLVSNLGNSLRARGREYCRSLSLQADRDIIIQIGTKSKIPVFAGTWFKVAHLRFTDLKIVAAEVTRVFAIACTNPDAIEMAGESYVKDPVDVWGKTATLGNAELAVRTHAPPLTFDRRGDVLRWIDFGSSTPNYKVGTGGLGGTNRRTNLRSLIGDFSLEMITGNLGECFTEGFTNDFHVGRIGVQACFAIHAADATYTSLRTEYYNGTSKSRGYISLNSDTKKILISLQASSIEIDDYDIAETQYDFSTCKLVVDHANKKYVRATVFGQEYDLSEYDLPAYANATKRRLQYRFMVDSGAGTGATIYLDSMILTENEPL